MHMPERNPHPSTLPGFRGTRDPERSVTRSRSGRKKKWVKFEDVQPQDISNPTEDNFPRRCITQLPDGVSHIYFTGKELTNQDSMRVHGTFTTVFKVWKDIATLLTVPYDDTWSILSNARQFLPNIDSSHIKSGNARIAHLRTYLTFEANREDDITIAHVFILFMMGHLWFQTAKDPIPLGYLAAVNDLDSTAQYDWGSAILASLYRGLDTAVTTGGAITGFVQLLSYWFFEYCGVGHPIVKEEVKYLAYPRLRAWERGNRRKINDQAANLFIIGRYHIDHRTLETITWEPWFDSTMSETEDVTGEVRIFLDPPLSMSPHISPATLQEMRQAGFVDCEQFVVGEERVTYSSYWAEQTSEVGRMLTNSQRMGNLDLFGPSALKASITPVVVTSASVHSLSQDFSLLGEVEGPDLGWHMEWAGRRERLPISRLRDPPLMSSSYGAEELWYLTHGMRRLVLAESVRDAQRLQEVEDELAIARRKIDNIDHQLYAHDLQLRRGSDVRVVPLPPEGGARTRQRGSGPRTRGGSTSRRGRGTGDDYE
ncbi:hypothetical protein GIB67_024381 [Kingdonia uniflora]|uniref:Aminotransferase-like plant mobile domain-containing protein n=1 Tax=Kingdonia uniflora TaxID=39325 RepID=A0A7J7LF87_9MAGN|nr:hypothetical protein GIB67_024381 [Kingdonia uniflora]